MSAGVATTPIQPRILAFDGHAFVDAPAPAGDPLAAGSWLVDDGTVLAWPLHVERFVASVAQQGGDPAVARAAALAAPPLVPATGAWFPRLDWHDGALLHVRPAPPLGARAVVRTASHDPRTTRGVKGPDLSALGAVRAEARAAGADEAILLDGGSVVDGATSAVLWWRDGALHAPPAALERVESVTARAIVGVATALGTAVDEESAAPSDLDGCEVWIVNALHGIRGVTAWLPSDDHADGSRAPRLAPADRADAWRSTLDRLRRPWI